MGTILLLLMFLCTELAPGTKIHIYARALPPRGVTAPAAAIHSAYGSCAAFFYNHSAGTAKELLSDW